jgi:enterochelin esterase-like enzyme
MESSRFSRSRVFGVLGLNVLLALVSGTQLNGQTAAQPPKGSVEQIKVHGKSLEGNLEGNSPDRDVFVYLPPSYAGNPNRRYPVVYLLHGYGLTAARWMTFANLAATADKDIAAGTMQEMILVNPDAFTVHSGSMYSASQTIGDWETFIAEDLVSFIDSRYRTIPNRMSRGLGGHSMGGYGTIRIGMKRPDVFSSLYLMSSCCLMNNPGARGNRGQDGRGAANPAAGNAPVAVGTAAAPAEGTANRGGQTGQANAAQGRGRGGGRGNTQFAQAAAWASNPKNPPQFFDLPVVDGQLQPLIAAKYAANSPMVMIDQYATNLKKYKAIMSDVGTQDGLAASNRQLVEIMTSLGIPHTFETYEGDHTNRVAQRFELKVLPFFSANLSFAAGR